MVATTINIEESAMSDWFNSGPCSQLEPLLGSMPFGLTRDIEGSVGLPALERACNPRQGQM